MRIYHDPFEQLLDQVVCECAEKMDQIQLQDLTFIPRVVYLEGDENSEEQKDEQN